MTCPTNRLEQKHLSNSALHIENRVTANYATLLIFNFLQKSARYSNGGGIFLGVFTADFNIRYR